jgi:hypothetical protein
MLHRTVLLSLVLPLGACGASHGSAEPDPQLVERLDECGFLGEGFVGPIVAAPFYAPDECYRECLTDAGCDELEAAACGTSIVLGQRCDQRCAHHCDNGALIAPRALCNGIDECGDMSDEEGCPVHSCGDGSSVPMASRCNGWSDCFDGSDEVGCAVSTVFRCLDSFGSAIVGDWMVCDGIRHCGDRSDEDACLPYACDDGRSIQYLPGRDPRCDGRWSCGDGSDERDCAQLELVCAP